MSKEAMKLALDALDEFCELGAIIRPLEVRDALREALAEQPAQQEPVAWVCYGSNNKLDIDFFEDDIADLAVGTKLYTQAQRTWVGLTDQEIKNLWNQHESRFDYYSFSCDIEAKLKEKNT